MGRGDAHGIEPRPRGVVFHEYEKFVDLLEIEKQSIPESFRFLGGQSPTADATVDFFPGHERPLVFAFGEAEAVIRKIARKKSGLNGPIETGAEGRQLFPKRDGTQRNGLLAFSPNTFVEIILKVGGHEILEQKVVAEFSENNFTLVRENIEKTRRRDGSRRPRSHRHCCDKAQLLLRRSAGRLNRQATEDRRDISPERRAICSLRHVAILDGSLEPLPEHGYN
jgi:hypothetical protein